MFYVSITPVCRKTFTYLDRNSRVGVRIKALMPGLRPLEIRSSIFWMIGMEKAAVLPVPVCAQPNKSDPSNTTGMASACMGVGVVYFSFLRAFRIGSISSNCSNVI